MNIPGLGESVTNLAKASGVRWYGHVLRRDEDDALINELRLKVEGQRKRRRPGKTWRGQIEEEIRGIGLRKKDAVDRAIWRSKPDHARKEVNPATPV